MFGQPVAEGFQVELLAGAREVVHLLAGEEFQRMLLVVYRTAADGHAVLGLVLVQTALGHQFTHQVVEIQPTVLGR
ncbi:hypothetical protein D3C76_1099530 [compost metagenome]